MSFDQLGSIESQLTTMRLSDDLEYQDDPEFDPFTEDLSAKLFSLTSNMSRLSQQINLLGTRRDTERVRERVHDLLEETRDGFKEVGEGIKRLTGWQDLNVMSRPGLSDATDDAIAFLEVHAAKSYRGNSRPQGRNFMAFKDFQLKSSVPLRPHPKLHSSLGSLPTCHYTAMTYSKSNSKNSCA
jgi:hypothetical protein